MSDKQELEALRRLKELEEKAGTPRQEEVVLQAPRGRPNALGAVGRGLNYFNDLTDQLAQGATFNLSDEVGAAGAFVGSQIGNRLRGEEPIAFNEALSTERERLKDFQQENPVAATTAQIAGGVAGVANLGNQGLTLLNNTARTVPQLVARGAAEGALLGGAFGAGAGEGTEDRVARAAGGAATGAIASGILTAAGGALAQRAASKAIPAVKSLKEQGQQLYREVERAGVIAKPQSYVAFADDITAEMKRQGINRVIHPDATAALKEIQNAKGSAMTISDLDTLRQVARGAAGSIKKPDRRLAQILIEKIDDYIGRLGPDDILAGNVETAAQSLTQARKVWRQSAQGELIEDLMERAKDRASQFSGSGLENAIRTEFRGLMRNRSAMRGLDPDLQAAVRKVARGGPVGNLLRQLGKFAPTGVVSSVLSGGAGAAIGGVPGAIALPAAGFAARQGATAITSRNARLASELARSGARAAPRAIPPETQALIRAMITGGAQQGQRLFSGR